MLVNMRLFYGLCSKIDVVFHLNLDETPRHHEAEEEGGAHAQGCEMFMVMLEHIYFDRKTLCLQSALFKPHKTN